MNLEDFKGIAFFKRILIMISFSNTALMIGGSLYFPTYYFPLIIVYDIYMTLRNLWALVYTVLGVYKTI
jgi:hypothetical protein